MWSNVKEWLSSKKAKALLVGLLTLGTTLALGDISTREFVVGALGMLGVYMGAQGLADAGKEKAKIEAGK